MADTVKKSRIVSDDDTNLEEALLEEFNIRLKNCMSQDDLQKEDSFAKNIPTNGISATKDFISNEIVMSENHYDIPKLPNGTKVDEEENIYENIPEKTEDMDQEAELSNTNKDLNLDVSVTSTNTVEEYEVINRQDTSGSSYEFVESTVEEKHGKPSFSLPMTRFEDFSSEKSLDFEQKTSVKDRMFLCTDDTSTLLFTQTVTSPMLTPSEENIDFLKGFQRENTNSDSTPPKEDEKVDNSEASEEISISEEEKPIITNGKGNIYENSEFLRNREANMYENLKSQNVYENVQNEEESIYENIDECIEKKKELHQTSNIEINIIPDNASIQEFIDKEKEYFTDEPKPQDQESLQENKINSSLEEMDKSNGDVIIESKVETYDELHESKQESTKIETKTEETFNVETNSKSTKLESESYSEFIYHTKSEQNSNYYEKYAELVSKIGENEISNREKDTETVPPEIVKNLKSQFMNKTGAEVVTTTKKGSDIELKRIDITKHINKFEKKECVDAADMDSTVYSETIVESSAPGEKSIKKKKTKKTRKEEKENISVNDSNSKLDGENYYNVNVKNLCRSFGDLTKVGNTKSSNRVLKKSNERLRTKSLSDVLPNNKKIENVFSGVSVRNLKERFNTICGTRNKSSSSGPFCKGKNENLKSSFSKFDALQKKNVLHIRSSDSSKAQEKFNGAQIVDMTNCKKCTKQVFQMEQIKAEKAVWHKNCFRCTECNKQLTVDIYESHEGSLYCKPHFKALFAPKAVEDEGPQRPRKPKLIICENEPLELPPDVVRASDKPDLGLEELSSLNVKERFQVFEHHQSQMETNIEQERGPTPVKRSPSILSKLARFQKHGMDVGVSNDQLDGIPVEESSTEEEEEEEEIDGEDADLVRAKRVQKEKPFHFTGMEDVKKKWEVGDQGREERREERKQEIQTIRNRLFLGKQEKMKEAYQQAIMTSESSANVKKNIADQIEVCDTKSIKDRFEKGEIASEKIKKTNDEEEVFESEISKKSRSLFLELDASASKPPQLSPVTPPKIEVKKAREAYLQRTSNEDTVKSSAEIVEDVEVSTADIQERFKFFETYKEPEKQRKQFRMTPPRDPSQVKAETPDREIYRDPEVVRSEEIVEDSVIAKETHTATKMLNKFRQMEEDLQKEPQPAGLKPLKRFTPPPEPLRQESNSEEEEETEEEYEEEEEEEEEVDNRLPDDLIEAQKAARAKQLRAKFEKWEQEEIKREEQQQQQQTAVNIVETSEETSQIESTRVLRARFESMKEVTTNKSSNPRVKVNRFVELSPVTETCQSCTDKVYPLEKISVHGHIYHKKCFKCMECSCILRMDSYSYNQGLLYCMHHFKRLFISKGNYDTGFGLDQHKEKWNINATVA